MLGWLTRLALLLVMAAGVAGIGAWWAHAQLDAPGPLAAPATFVVAKGTGRREIARDLATAGIVKSASLFEIETVIADGRNLKAGEYAFPAGASMRIVIDKMRKGEVVAHRITVPEGLTVRQIMALIQATPGLEGQVTSLPPEGSLQPDTYQFLLGDSRASIIARMSKALSESIDQLWDKRKPDLPIASKQEAIVLASIVERETGLAAERPRIAAVFHNRLRQHMKLQSDPTTIYDASNGEGVLDRGLSQRDLDAATPHNTYVIDGLPPTPISNPGHASIEAVLLPFVSEELYFVADGTGGHVFAKTLAEHNRNVARWRQVEKTRAQTPIKAPAPSPAPAAAPSTPAPEFPPGFRGAPS